MAARGFFGCSIPEEYGGASLTTEALVMGALELSQYAVAYRARVGSNTGIGAQGLVADGTEAQKRRFLPLLASGEQTGCLALTEPDAGSKTSALKTMAIRDGDDYILNGNKCYITDAPIADLFTAMARTNLNSIRASSVNAFIVERSTPGLTTEPVYKMMASRGLRLARFISKTVVCQPKT